jgi:hypothetical protein
METICLHRDHRDQRLVSLGYHWPMKSKSSPEYQKFTGALRTVLSVSKADMNRMLEEERQSKIGKVKPGPKPKTSTSGHAVSDKG